MSACTLKLQVKASHFGQKAKQKDQGMPNNVAMNKRLQMHVNSFIIQRPLCSSLDSRAALEQLEKNRKGKTVLIEELSFHLHAICCIVAHRVVVACGFPVAAGLATSCLCCTMPQFCLLACLASACIKGRLFAHACNTRSRSKSCI